MDLTAAGGFALGAALLILALARGGSIVDFVDLQALMITLGGTLAATMMHYPLRQIAATLGALRRPAAGAAGGSTAVVATLVELAERARRDGLLALEPAAAHLPDSFLGQGLQLVVDGTDPGQLRAMLENELTLLERDLRSQAAPLETMAQLAPAFGLIGTLIGMVQMLRTLDDPARIGPGMAVALLTTLYGALLANMVCSPLAGRLRVTAAAIVLEKEIMLEGVLAIQAGDTPRLVAEKLRPFLPAGRSVPERSSIAPGASTATDQDLLWSERREVQG